jgi:hypothetical protein
MSVMPSVKRLHVADGTGDIANGAEEIPGRRFRASIATSSVPKLRRSEVSEARLPILLLRPTGDGTGLARALARVLVRRELRQERALDTVEDCAKSK